MRSEERLARYKTNTINPWKNKRCLKIIAEIKKRHNVQNEASNSKIHSAGREAKTGSRIARRLQMLVRSVYKKYCSYDEFPI